MHGISRREIFTSHLHLLRAVPFWALLGGDLGPSSITACPIHCCVFLTLSQELVAVERVNSSIIEPKDKRLF